MYARNTVEQAPADPCIGEVYISAGQCDNPRAMRTPTLALTAMAVATAAAVTVTAERGDEAAALLNVLEAAGQRVLRYVARAQHLVCTEVVRLQPLTAGWSSDGFARTVESELHLSWTPPDDGSVTTEAQALRQVLRVNGHQPRADDHGNCTTPEQETREPQPLVMLLPSERDGYAFKMAGLARLDRRAAIMIDYRRLKKAAVESHMVEERDDCVSFNVEGGMQGRLWIDAETFEVLRVDQRLVGMVEIPLPKAIARLPDSPRSWTLERMDTSIRFRTVTFTNPDETLMLPASISSLSITRGSGTPRLRTTTEFVNYQRFLTGGRIVGQ